MSGHASVEAHAPERGPVRRDIQRRVAAAQTALLFELSPQPVIAGMVFTVVAALVLWPTLGGAALLAWTLVRLVVSSLRLWDCHDFLRRPPASIDLGVRWRRFMVLTGAECAGWSALGLLFAPTAGPQIAPLLMASIGVVSAVSLFSLASDYRASLLFFTTILLPNGIQQLLMATPESIFVGTGLLLIQAILSVEALGLSRRIAELLRLRHENSAIAEQRQHALLMAEHSNQAKSRFLAIVSHEMRTPLNGILGMAQLMQRTANDATQRAQLEVILQSGRHLHSVIGDLLDLSRIESGKLAIDAAPVKLTDLVREVTDLLGAAATRQGLRFDIESDPALPVWVNADAARVKQVLHNLLGNAIKFTTKGRVALSVSHREGQFEFAVRDTGPGIPADQTERIFRAFEQIADNGPGSHRSGTGLGLTISRDLARAMGGDIVCESVLGEGSVFRLRLPLQIAEAPAAAASSIDDQVSLSGKVLLVEDSPINALIAREMLEQLGLQVEVAENGEAALQRLSRAPFDAVLMDCQMPVLDGWQATQRWREHEASAGLPRMPIIALTANAVLGDRERCLQAGMDDYLAKPVDMDVLAQTMARHLRATGGAT